MKNLNVLNLVVAPSRMFKRRTSKTSPQIYNDLDTPVSSRELTVVAHAHFQSLEDQLADYVQQNKEIALKCHKLKEKVKYMEDEIECERIKNRKLGEEMTFYMEKNQKLELKCKVLENNLNQTTNKNRMLIKEKEALLATGSIEGSREQANKIDKMYDEQIDFLQEQLEKMKIRKNELNTLLEPPSKHDSNSNYMESEEKSEKNYQPKSNRPQPQRTVSCNHIGRSYVPEEGVCMEDDDYYMETNELDHRARKNRRRSCF